MSRYLHFKQTMRRNHLLLAGSLAAVACLGASYLLIGKSGTTSGQIERVGRAEAGQETVEVDQERISSHPKRQEYVSDITSPTNEKALLRVSSSADFPLSSFSTSADQKVWTQHPNRVSGAEIATSAHWVKAIGHKAQALDLDQAAGLHRLTLEPDIMISVVTTSAFPPEIVSMAIPYPRLRTVPGELSIVDITQGAWRVALDSEPFIEKFGSGQTTFHLNLSNGARIDLSFTPISGSRIYEELIGVAAVTPRAGKGFIDVGELSPSDSNLDIEVVSNDYWDQFDPEWPLAPNTIRREWGTARYSWIRDPVSEPTLIEKGIFEIEGLLHGAGYTVTAGSTESGVYGRKSFIFDGSTVILDLHRAPVIQGQIDQSTRIDGPAKLSLDFGESYWTNDRPFSIEPVSRRFSFSPIKVEFIPKRDGIFPLPSECHFEMTLPGYEALSKNLVLEPGLAVIDLGILEPKPRTDRFVLSGFEADKCRQINVRVGNHDLVLFPDFVRDQEEGRVAFFPERLTSAELPPLQAAAFSSTFIIAGENGNGFGLRREPDGVHRPVDLGAQYVMAVEFGANSPTDRGIIDAGWKWNNIRVDLRGSPLFSAKSNTLEFFGPTSGVSVWFEVRAQDGIEGIGPASIDVTPMTTRVSPF